MFRGGVTCLFRRKILATTVTSSSRITPDPKEVCRVTSTAVSLLCSLHRHIHTTCAWYIQILLLSCDISLPILPLPIATWCIDTCPWIQPGCLEYSLSLHAIQPSHAYTQHAGLVVSLSHSWIHTYILHNTIYTHSVLYRVLLYISYTMYSTTTQATTIAHYIHYFLCTTSLVPHYTTLCYKQTPFSICVHA